MIRGARALGDRGRAARGLPGVAVALLLAAGLAGCAIAPPGTQAPYTVRGRTYVPLADWRGFTEEGLASWYGAEHRGRPTASGERFDPGAFTAAHPVLPMHVCVRVESLDSGRAVTVRVNDRGPFLPGRVIDLTRAAAAALGILGEGTARVRLAAVGLAGEGGRCPAAAAGADPGGRAAPGRVRLVTGAPGDPREDSR